MTPEQLVEKKRRVLLKIDDSDRAYQVIIDPALLSNDKQYIYFGNFYSDEIRGWHRVESVAKSIVSVLQDHWEEKPAKQKWSLWKCIAETF